MSNIIGYELDWWENQNEDMDLAAKAHWTDTHRLVRPTAASLSAYKGWHHVLYHQWKLPHVQVALSYEAIQTPITEEYWVTRKII
jgi:hypothetical protein